MNRAQWAKGTASRRQSYVQLKSLKGERNTHKNTVCRNTGSKLSQTDEIHRTKKPNELQTQETKKTRPKDTTARQEENPKK